MQKKKFDYGYGGGGDNSYGDWKTAEEARLHRKWGFSGTVPGQKSSATNYALESGEKEIKRLLGASTDEEYAVAIKDFCHKNYNIQAVNDRHSRLNLPPIVNDGQFCFTCGDRHDPFAGADYKQQLERNICLSCQFGSSV